jgi:hypothetical protein
VATRTPRDSSPSSRRVTLGVSSPRLSVPSPRYARRRFLPAPPRIKLLPEFCALHPELRLPRISPRSSQSFFPTPPRALATCPPEFFPGFHPKRLPHRSGERLPAPPCGDVVTSLSQRLLNCTRASAVNRELQLSFVGAICAHGSSRIEPVRPSRRLPHRRKDAQTH